jgi:hypothetical protein
MRSQRSNLIVSVMFAAAMSLTPLTDAGETTQEYRVKAAFIFNFMQFVEWPTGTFANDNAPFVVAVVGHDPFEGALEQAMASKTIRSRNIVVRYFSTADSIEPCQLLFVPAGEDDSAARIIGDKVADRPVLTIGESDAFMGAGGVIRFYNEENKVRFEIAPQAAERGHLKISSKLLRLARIFTK